MKNVQSIFTFMRMRNKFLVRFSAIIMLIIFLCQFTFVPGEIFAATSTPYPTSAVSSSVTVPLNGSSASVAVSGYSSITSGRYKFSGTLTYTFTSPANTNFNKFSINYYSNQAVKGVIYYTESSSTKSEEFFLEKNTSAGVFTSFTDNYLINKKAAKISKIVFTPLSASTATLKINSITTTVAEVYTSDTVYLENSRFKLGCCLIWGGGLNYIEDKKDGDSTIGNMLNKHDTGRLVQQSYYGTSSYPYDCGDYNGTTWGYNPVQGGNLYGEKSKLIDCIVTDTYIYVKCRPRDWAKEGIYSLSYMENKYTLESTHITVDNRFIDFSGYNHGSPRHQELPAFYTISYFDKFTFYNGSKPWTDDTLTTKGNLGFWGDQANRSECYTDIKSGNTETWCSWTSKETGYGIGLYTPDVSILLAGRNAYNGSKSPTNDATNYVAPLKTYTMQNYTPYSYTYYITAGNVDTIRKVFKAQALNLDVDVDVESGEIDYTRLTFDDSYQLNALSDINDAVATTSNGSAKFVTSSSAGNNWDFDVYAYVNYAMNSEVLYTNEYKYLVFTYMIPTGNYYSSYNMEIFICVGDDTYASAGKSLTKKLIRDGKYHSLVINLSGYTNLWPSSGKKINKLRFDLMDEPNAGDIIYVSEISLAKTKAAANNYAVASTSSTAATPTASATPSSTATSKPTSSANSTTTSSPPLYTGGITLSPSSGTGSSSSTAGGLNTAGSSNKVNPSGTAGTSVTLSPSTTPSHGEDSSVLVEITDKGNNTFDDNTKITVAKASDTAEIDKNITACFGTEIRYIITNMSINATLNSPIMLTVTLPEGYNNNKTMAYMASQDGKLTTVNSSYTDGKLVFITDKLGTVVFVNTSPIHETETPSTTTPEITESELPESSASHTAGDENNDSESASAPTADTEENTTKTDNRSSDSNKGNKKNIKVILTVILIITIIVIGGIIFLLLFLKKKRKK